MRCFRSIENSNPNPHQATEHLVSLRHVLPTC